MTYGEIFAGISGFGLGFHREGFECLWQIEWNKRCNHVLRRHYPNVKRYGNVAHCGRGREHPLERADIILFGSPCQDLSIAGTRTGIVHGDKSKYFFDATRIIHEQKPEIAIWENVDGAFTSNTGRDFLFVLRELVARGAREIGWRRFDAQYFGLAQRRQRIFLVADFRGTRCAEILSLSEGVRGYPPPCREEGQKVAGTLATRLNRGSDADQAGQGNFLSPTVTARHKQGSDMPVVAGTLYAGTDSGSNEPGNKIIDLAPTLTASDGRRCGMGSGGGKGEENRLIAGTVTSKWAKGGGPAGDEKHNLVAETMRSHPYPGSNSLGGVVPTVTTQSGRLGGAVGQNCIRIDHQHGHGAGLLEDGTCHTVGGSCDAVAHGSGVRIFTPRECERLQGFPDDWTAWGVNIKGKRVNISDSARYEMLGNAVAVACGHYLAKRVKEVLRGQRRTRTTKAS